MLGTRQQEIIEALAVGGLVFDELRRRVAGSRKELVRAISRLEASGIVRIARRRTRLHPGDLVTLAAGDHPAAPARATPR